MSKRMMACVLAGLSLAAVSGAAMRAEAFDWIRPAGAVQRQNLQDMVPDLKGKPAPNFSLTYLDGKPASLAQFKGHVVVLDFWATWCVPCREALPSLDALYQAKKANGLRVLAMDASEDAATVKAFVEKTKLKVPVVMDPDGKAQDAYKIQGFPTQVVIGKDGMVSAVFVGVGPGSEQRLAQAVDKAMSKP